METTKDDHYYIQKVIDEIELVCSYSSNMSIDDLTNRPAEFDGIVFRLIQAAEHAERISRSFKENHQEINWINLKGFRNRLVHDYGSVDLSYVYKAIKVDAPQLKETLIMVLKEK